MSDQPRIFGRDFFFWQGGRFASNLARSMTEVALVWQVYQLTHNPVALGLVGLTEAVPFLLSSLWAGHLVDRHHKKPFMMAAVGSLLVCSGVLFTFGAQSKTPLLFYAVVAAIGGAVSFGNVASSVFLQMMVPRESFSRAAAWSLSGFTIAIILGPLLGGWIMAAHGPKAVYAAAAGLALLSLALFTGLRFRPPLAPASPESAMRRIWGGVEFVRSRPLLLACMCLDMVAVLFGDAVALFPIFAELLRAGPMGFGLLRASPPAGAALLSLAHTAWGFVRPTWGWLKRAVAAFGLFMIAFALSKTLWSACLFLVLAGVVDGVSVIIRQSIYQAGTPDNLRGRVSALSGIFISTSNEIGAFESGVAARLLGTVPSVIFGGCMTVATVFFMSSRFKHVPEE